MVLAAPLPSKNSLVVKKGHKKLKKTKRAFLCLDNGWTENSIFISMLPTKTAELLLPRGKHLAPKKGGD